MWKTCGYIVHTGEYPLTAFYLTYDIVNEEYCWNDDPNQATIFSTIDHATSILSKFGDIDIDLCMFRVAIMTDEPITTYHSVKEYTN
jgi:hypothetical protein